MNTFPYANYRAPTLQSISNIVLFHLSHPATSFLFRYLSLLIKKRIRVPWITQISRLDVFKKQSVKNK